MPNQNAQTDIEKSEKARFFLSTIGTILLTGIYLGFIIVAVRHRLWVEVSISLLLPLFMLLSKRAKYFFEKPLTMVMKRVFQLVIFESFYNALVIITLFAILFGSASVNAFTAWAFVLFFIIQTGGFVVSLIQRNKSHGIFQSVILFACIILWFYNIQDTSSIVDAQGRFLMWGQEAPLAVKLIYTIWAINGLLADTTVLPRFTQAIVQLVSIALCWWSAEFFHARLLTACHLFLLDGIFAYSISDPLGRRICVMPDAYFEGFKKHIQPRIAVTCSLLILVVVVISYVRGGVDIGF